LYHKHHTKGIILSGRDDGDDSKRLSIFTESFGLISARVQGARNIHSKLRGGSQDLSIGEFSLVRGKSGWKLVSAKSIKNIFEIFRYHPEKLKVSVNVLGLVKKLVAEEDHNSLFVIVSNFLDFLVNSDDDSIPLSECLVLLRILHSLGYMRHDPDFSIPISSLEIETKDLEAIAPRRLKMIELINESLKATNLT